MSGRRLRIGEAAALAGVSVRTLRYYEELGLLTPSARSPGGARRYAEEDVARLARIRELKDLLGFNLDEVRTVLTAEDRLGDLRAAFHAEDDRAAQRAIIAEPFKHGLAIVFLAALAMSLVAAAASWLRGGRYVHEELVQAAAVTARSGGG